MDKVYISKEMCSGCKACIDICPTKAITMCKDEEGFEYPQINQEKCINCGKCSRLCAFKRKNINEAQKPISIIGVKAKNEKERISSRSGGIFSVLANYIIEQSGIVYGCVLSKDLEVHHARATTQEQLKEFKGSKYVKSNLKNVYSEAKNDLQEGKIVLFSGTGCEIAGLYATLKNVDTSKLYTCDLICHGVPTPLIYEEYIKFMEKKENQKITHVDFRDKSFGWSTHKETLSFEDGKKLTANYYTELFYSHHILRPSCYNCQFSNMDRVSDITIGDFWGIQKENPEFYDEKGISLALVNTGKGQEILEHIKEKLDWIEVKSQHYMQPNLQHPSKKPENRNEFWEDYKQKGFEYIMEKYAYFEGDEN